MARGKAGIGTRAFLLKSPSIWGFPGGSVVKYTPANAQVRSLVGEDSTCQGTTKPMHHDDWACALEPRSRNYWADAA